MTTLTRNLSIHQGATFSNTITYTTNTFSNTATANAMARAYFTSNTHYDFAVAIGNNSLTLTMTANVTATMNADQYVYDVKITDGNTVYKAVEGTIIINLGVTHS